MKMNNKYLSGLLAGVLTAGAVQGSGNKGKIPEMGEKQTSMVLEQSISELPGDLRDLLLAFNQSLAERGYQAAQVRLNSLQMPSQMTQITLGETSEMQQEESLLGIDLGETNEVQKEEPLLGIDLGGSTMFLQQKKVDTDFHSAREIPDNARGKLDPFHMQTVQQRMGYTKNKDNKSGTTEDLINLMQVSKKFADQPERNRINTIPVTGNKKFFRKIQTQQIFGPDDCILPGMHKYIITYPVTRAEIEAWIAKLKTINEGNLDDNQIIVNCQNVNIDEDCKYDYRTDTINLNFDVKPEVRHLVDIKKRKCFLPVVIGGTYENIFETVVKALADNIVFEKIVLRSTFAPHIVEVFNALKKENICAFEIDRADGVAAMQSDIVRFFLGYPKISYIPLLKFIDCEKDLFVFVKKIEDTLPIEFSKNCNDLDFYAPFLEQSSSLSLPTHSKMYCPYLKKIETSGIRKPEVLYVSQDFDISQLSEDWKNSVKRYTTQQIQEIELAKEELLAYIDINPELSDASLNCPKPASVSQKKWDDLIKLKNKLMALLRGEVSLNDGSVLARLESMDYTIRDVRGDGNCGVYAVLQALHPEQNYLNVQANDERWNAAQALRNVLPVGHPGREMAQNASDHVRWIEDRDFQYFAQYLGRSILFISERGQIIEYNRNANMHVYNSLEEAFEQKAQDAIIIYHNGIDHFETIVPMPNA